MKKKIGEEGVEACLRSKIKYLLPFLESIPEERIASEIISVVPPSLEIIIHD